MSSSESRLLAVERQLRLHRLVIAGLLVAIVALVGLGATKGVPDEVRAKSFVVVNGEGREVVVIASGTMGGTIVTYPSKGPSVPLVFITQSDGGHGFMAVGSNDGRIGVVLVGLNDKGGGGSVLVQNKAGQVVATATVDEYGMGLVGAYDHDGRGHTLMPR
jgi:hypothetical protein